MFTFLLNLTIKYGKNYAIKYGKNYAINLKADFSTPHPQY